MPNRKPDPLFEQIKKPTEKTKTFELGKVDMEAYWRQSKDYKDFEYPVTVEVTLKYDPDKGPIFSACGNVWEKDRSDIIMGGQCFDTLAQTNITTDPTFVEIYRLWKLYHLNDMHAGTSEQEEAIRQGVKNGELSDHFDYKATVQYLKDKNLYEVPLNGTTYRYGHAWLYEPIPEEDLNKIKELLK